MTRDIDQIIDRISREHPEVRISQLEVRYPGADDDGLWFFLKPGVGTVTIESSSGNCPFLVESYFDDERLTANTVDEVVTTVLTKLAGDAGL